jgi:hypothetical protein
MNLGRDPSNSRKHPTQLQDSQEAASTFQNLLDLYPPFSPSIEIISIRIPPIMITCNNKITTIKKVTTKKIKEHALQILTMATNQETHHITQKKDLSTGTKKISFKTVSKTINKAS